MNIECLALEISLGKPDEENNRSSKLAKSVKSMKYRDSKAPILCAIYIFLVFIPEDFYWFVGQIRFEPYRVFLIASAVLLSQKIINHQYDKKEIALLSYCGLCSISFIDNHGAHGIQSSLILFLEVMVSYFIGMSLGGNIVKLKKCISIMMSFFFILVPFAIVESQSGYRFFHVLFADFIGTQALEVLGPDYFRYGLHRASTVFSHPILYSVIAMMYMPLVFRLYRLPVAFACSIGIVTALITSVTSASILMLLLMIVLTLMERNKKRIPSIYKMAIFLSIAIYLFLLVASNRGPIQVLIQLSSLNPGTAYTRYLQWQFASADILANPILGIGFNDWSRPFWLPPSIDSYWLLVALQSGLPALLALSTFFVISLKHYWVEFNRTNERLYFCFFVSISAFVLAAFTVDYFDRAQLILFLTMGFYNSFTYKKGILGRRDIK